MKKTINRTLPIGLAFLMVLLLLPWSMLHVQGAETPNIGFTASAASLREGETLTVTITNKAMTITTFAGGFAFDKELLEVTEVIPTVPAEVESRSVHSTIEEANNAGTVGLAFTSKEVKDTTYEAGTFMTVKLEAKKAGTSALRLYEDSDGANGYQSDSIETKEIEIIPRENPPQATPNIGFTASAASLREGETLTVTITNKAMTITSFAGGFAFDKELLEVTEIIPTVPAEVESRSVHSTIEEANNAGTVGLAFTSKEAKDTTYEAGTLMTVKLKAKKAGKAALTLYEDSDGANGYQSDSIETKEIEITSSPISSLQVEPIEIIEGTCDYRNLWMNMANMNTKVTVIYNGQEYTGRFTEVSSKINEITGGKNYFNFKYDPSAADQWTVGHEYDITVEFMEKTTPAKVRIIPSPVSSIQIEKDPIEIIEGTCGREIRIPDATSDLKDLVYFHYDPVRDESVKATVIYDGREYTGSLNQISEQIRNEAKHNDSLLFVSDQSYYNQWTVGNEYDAAISFLGKTVPVKVKIVSENEGLKGDVNGDGNVDAKDLTTLAKHVAKIALITDENLIKAADVNGDGNVDAKDLTHLAKYVAKIIPEL